MNHTHYGSDDHHHSQQRRRYLMTVQYPLKSMVGSSAMCSFALPYGTSRTLVTTELLPLIVELVLVALPAPELPMHVLAAPVGGAPGVAFSHSGQSIKHACGRDILLVGAPERRRRGATRPRPARPGGALHGRRLAIIGWLWTVSSSAAGTA